MARSKAAKQRSSERRRRANQERRRELCTKSWADITPDLLNLMVRKLHKIEDFFAFRACCTSWRSVAPIKIFDSKHQFPMLLQTNKSYIAHAEAKKHELSNFLATKVNGDRPTIYKRPILFGPGSRGYSYCLGWKGWIFVVEYETGSAYLQHLFSQTLIRVPSLSEGVKWYIDKRFLIRAALSCNPLTNPLEFMLMVIFEPDWNRQSKVIFWRHGDKTCTKVIQLEDDVYCMDIVFFNGFFYSITSERNLLKFDATDPTLYSIMGKIPFILDKYNMNYFVESNGQLLFVVGNSERDDTRSFKLHAYELQIRSYEWVEIKDLGDRAIFISNGTSFSVDSSEISGCKRNCVYFFLHEDSNKRCSPDEYHCIGIYNLTDGLVGKHYCALHITDSRVESVYHRNYTKRPVWVLPTFF